MEASADRMTARRAVVPQAALREDNLARVACLVFKAPRPLSRAGVAVQAGVSRATASRLVDDLVRGGMLAEVGTTQSGGRGRPGVDLAPSGARFVALGLQVGVAHLTVRALDLAGEIVAEERRSGDFVGSQAGRVLGRLGRLAADLIAGLRPGVQVVGAGVALPGLVSRDSGLLHHAANLGWSEVDVTARLGPALDGIAISVGNEAAFAAVSAARSAPGRPSGLHDFLYLSGEVGIGGAIVRDGEVLGGRHGWAGEIGHMCVDPAGPPCGCGATGCLEAYAGRRALLTAARLPPDGSPKLIVAAHRTGDRAAQDALSAAATAIGIAVSGAIHLLDLPTVVLGGDLALIGPSILERVRDGMLARLISGRWSTPELRIGPTDPSAPATGAAIAELERIINAPAAFL